MNDPKTPPSSPEAERALLGAILIDTAGRGDDRVMDMCLTSGIAAESFLDARNRAIYETMLEMNLHSRPLDVITLMEEMRRTGKLETIGGSGYLQSLVEQVPTAAHAEHYAGIVRDKHLRRVMIDRATKVVTHCFDEEAFPDPQVVLGDAERSFLEIGGNGSGTMSWQQAIDISSQRIDKMFEANGRTLEGLSTGLRYLDERIQGLKPSEMIVIAARPSVGKTSLAMNIAESVATGRDLNGNPNRADDGKRHPVMIFSLEMPVEALTKRMIAGHAGINMWELNRNLVHKERKRELTRNLAIAVDELRDAPIYVDDTAALDVMDLRARARRMKKQHGIELIVIDYLQLCCCREGARQSRVIEVSMISQQIKAMAKELRIPVIVLSQLSRANEQRGDKQERPKLSDLRDSGAIEQDADMVFLLRRPSRTPSDSRANDLTLAIIDVAKNRNGETGEVEVDFIREFTRFRDREPVAKGVENMQSSEGEPDRPEHFEDPLL